MMTRRRLGQAAALAGAAVSVGSMKASGTDAESVAQDAGLDPVHWTLEQYKSAPLRLTFQAQTKSEAEAWQQQLRAKLTELVGGFPDRTPLNARTLDTRDFAGYRR